MLECPLRSPTGQEPCHYDFSQFPLGHSALTSIVIPKHRPNGPDPAERRFHIANRRPVLWTAIPLYEPSSDERHKGQRNLGDTWSLWRPQITKVHCDHP